MNHDPRASLLLRDLCAQLLWACKLNCIVIYELAVRLHPAFQADPCHSFQHELRGRAFDVEEPAAKTAIIELDADIVSPPVIWIAGVQAYVCQSILHFISPPFFGQSASAWPDTSQGQSRSTLRKMEGTPLGK
jgi:hypothetical protein